MPKPPHSATKRPPGEKNYYEAFNQDNVDVVDLRATPMDEVYPGVEVHANLIAGILRGELLEAPAYTVGAEVLLLLIGGIAMIIAGVLLSPLATMIFGLLAGVLFAVAVVTDLCDGPVARRRGEASPRGALFDHAVDATFVAALLGALAWRGVLTPLLPLLAAIALRWPRS